MREKWNMEGQGPPQSTCKEEAGGGPSSGRDVAVWWLGVVIFSFSFCISFLFFKRRWGKGDWGRPTLKPRPCFGGEMYV